MVSCKVNGLLRPRWIGSASSCSTSGWTDSHSHPSSVPPFPGENDNAVWSEQSSLLGLGAGAWSLALMHLSMRMRYKTQLATTLSGVSFGLPAHLRIFDQVASELSHAKATCLHIHGFYLRVLRCLIHPKPFTVRRPFSHGFVEKISNKGMLCVS